MSILATLPAVTADDATAAARKLDRTRTYDAKAATVARRQARALKRGHDATRAGRRAAKRD
jgi:hypothetical protein